MYGPPPTRIMPQVQSTNFPLDGRTVALTRHILSRGRWSKVTTHSCYNCQKSGTKKDMLKLCQRCERALYCSGECQRAHWPIHKKHCEYSEYEASLEWNDMILAASSKFGSPGLPVPPPGMTWQDLHKRFKKWFSFHMMTLFAVSIHSLQLPQDRAASHILLIQIEYHNGSTEVGKYFKLNKMQVITLDEATDMAGPPMQTFREERKEQEDRVLLGLLIQCLPMIPGFHVFPIAALSKESTAMLPWIPNCQEVLEDRFHNGKRF